MHRAKGKQLKSVKGYAPQAPVKHQIVRPNKHVNLEPPLRKAALPGEKLDGRSLP